jgi:hypothetical protein
MPNNNASPPFATSDGKPKSTGSSGGSGGRDFTQENRPQSGAETGGAAKQGGSGGRDFTKESRPQSEAKPEVVANPQEIPKGGKILLADPGPVSAKVAGTATQTGPSAKLPIKGMK